MNYPEYVEIEGKYYKINTDFRVAIKCDEVARDITIGDNERALAIIYLLFDVEGLQDKKNHEKLLELARKYLACGKELKKHDEEPDMDFVEDMDYIEASFMSDFHIDLSNITMHWWKFNKLMNGLSNNEFGNCCILNRVRNLRNLDLSKITDEKEFKELSKAKQNVALKRNKKERNLTKEQEKSLNELYEILGL